MKNKFRGISINSGKWVYGYLFEFEKTTFILKDIDYNGEKVKHICDIKWEQVFSKTVCRCTEKNDIDDNKIFEGDVIRGSFGIPPVSVDAVVEYKNTSFMIETPSCNPKSCTVEEAVKYLNAYVVGNKFDNPELLEDIS